MHSCSIYQYTIVCLQTNNFAEVQNSMRVQLRNEGGLFRSMMHEVTLQTRRIEELREAIQIRKNVGYVRGTGGECATQLIMFMRVPSSRV